MAKSQASGNPLPASPIGYVAVLAATAAWGTSGIAVHFISESQITALALAFWRDLSTFLVLFVGLRALRPAWLEVKRRDLPWLVGLGCSLGTFHVLWNLGVMLNGAPVATVQQAAMPAIVAIAAWVIWREPLTWRKILAVILTFAGTALVSGIEELRQTELSSKGFLVGLGIPLFYAAWNLIGKKVRQDVNSLTVLTYAFGFGALVLFPLQFFTEQPWPVHMTTALWFAGLVIVSTILPFIAYLFALGRLPAGIASILAMTEIAFVSIYAYLFLDEWMESSQVVGTVLVVVGISLLFRRNSSKASSS
jgi:drug/metabolite transporter (DMT)-like permease